MHNLLLQIPPGRVSVECIMQISGLLGREGVELGLGGAVFPCEPLSPPSSVVNDDAYQSQTHSHQRWNYPMSASELACYLVSTGVDLQPHLFGIGARGGIGSPRPLVELLNQLSSTDMLDDSMSVSLEVAVELFDICACSSKMHVEHLHVALNSSIKPFAVVELCDPFLKLFLIFVGSHYRIF